MQKKLLITLGIFLIFGAVVFYYRDRIITTLHVALSDGRTQKTCSQISINDTKTRTAKIDNHRNQYASSARRLMGLSTEGGEQINYTDAYGNIKFIYQEFYGEKGKSEASYYLEDNKVFFISTISLHIRSLFLKTLAEKLKRTKLKSSI